MEGMRLKTTHIDKKGSDSGDRRWPLIKTDALLRFHELPSDIVMAR